MDLIGAKVRHITWGDGTIKGCDGRFLAVEFSIGRKHFFYPRAFEKFLTAEDPVLQSALLKEIEQKRAAGLITVKFDSH